MPSLTEVDEFTKGRAFAKDVFNQIGDAATASVNVVAGAAVYSARLTVDGATIMADATVGGARAVAEVGKDVAEATTKLVTPTAVVTDHEEATPASCWYTPRTGWPTAASSGVAGWLAPPEMLPTEADENAACLFEGLDEETIGELRVEVLEATNLEIKDMLNSDPYVVYVFEGFAARTATIHDTVHPKWSKTAARAARFPVQKPYSCLYVALQDDDQSDTTRFVTGGLDLNSDALGRVVIPLANAASHTVYDVWMPLHIGTAMLRTGTLGYVRLRWSVTFKSEASRMLEYPFDSPRTFVLPFTSREALRDAKFALHGTNSDVTYHWAMLKAHYDEVSEHLSWFASCWPVIRSIAFWEWPLAILSAAIAIGLQLLITYPEAIPSMLPLAVLASLHFTYAAHQPTFAQQPPPHQLLCLLLGPFASKLPPLTLPPAGGAPFAKLHILRNEVDGLNKEGKDGQGASNAAGPTLKEVLRDVQDEVNAAIEDALDADDSTGDGAAKLLARVKNSSRAHTHVKQAASAAKAGHSGAAVTDADIDNEMGGMSIASVNIMNRIVAPVLGPIQQLLGTWLKPLRQLRRLLSWRDRRLTLWLYVGLALLAVVLEVVDHLMPWPTILYWLTRLVAFALTGPHMYYVGQHLTSRASAHADEEAAFMAAYSRPRAERDAIQEAIVDGHRQAMNDAALKRITKELSSRESPFNAREAARAKYYRSAKVKFVFPVPLLEADKDLLLPDPAKSRAYPLYDLL